MHNYNTRVHRTLNMSPMKALSLGKRTPEDVGYVTKLYEKGDKQFLQSQNLSIGDVVRLLIRKSALTDKGSAPRWTSTIHRIVSENNGSFFVTGRSSPYKQYELLKTAHKSEEPERVIQQEASEREQTEARRAKRVSRRVRQEGIKPSEVSIRRSARERAPSDAFFAPRFGVVRGNEY